MPIEQKDSESIFKRLNLWLFVTAPLQNQYIVPRAMYMNYNISVILTVVLNIISGNLGEKKNLKSLLTGAVMEKQTENQMRTLSWQVACRLFCSCFINEGQNQLLEEVNL